MARAHRADGLRAIPLGAGSKVRRPARKLQVEVEAGFAL